jgi:hypothetical protein
LSEPTVQRLIDSCHRQAELVEGDTHDSRVAEVSAVTRSMSRATVDGTGKGSRTPRLGDDLQHVDVTRANGQAEMDHVTDDDLPDVDDEPSFVNPDNVSTEVTVGDSSDVSTLAAEQAADETLKTAFSLVRRNKGGYTIKDGVLFHLGINYGQHITSLVVPVGRRLGVLKLAHNSVHWAANKMKQPHLAYTSI